jgi:hypothetical protein
LYDKENKNYDDILTSNSENGVYKFRYTYLNLKIGDFEAITCSVDIDEDELFSMSEICEKISQRDDIDLKIGRVKMFEYLRNFGILNHNNLPTEEILIAGNYFSVKKDIANGKVFPTTYTTKKGIDYIVSVFKSRNIIL